MKKFILKTPLGDNLTGGLYAEPARRFIEIYNLDPDYGWEPWTTATVNINGLSGDEVAIKNYSENEGILDLLIGLGVIEPPHRRVASGFVMIDICNMNRSKLEEPGTAGETASDTLTVRIFTRDSIAVDVGDMIAPGLVSAAVTSSADVLKMFPDSFKVLRVRDNRRGSLQMQHWRIEGE